MNLFFRRPRRNEAAEATCAQLPGKGLVTANALFGSKVVNLRNETLGTVTEIMLDAQHGCIAYAVIANGGFMGVDQQFFAIPWSALSFEAPGRLVLDADRKRLAAAPRFDRESWSSETDAEWHRAVHRHYGSRPYWE